MSKNAQAKILHENTLKIIAFLREQLIRLIIKTLKTQPTFFHSSIFYFRENSGTRKQPIQLAAKKRLARCITEIDTDTDISWRIINAAQKAM